jgi:class 3 adenylate cyclase
VSEGRILVVDDHAPNIRLLGAILEPRGYTVLPASSGAEALALVADERPDLVLLDIVMPGLDGYETCRRIRESGDGALLPVIMVTASGDEQKQRALDAGADDFIQKPLNDAELLARVRSLLRIKRYHDDLAALNHTLEDRVRAQVEELERVARLKRFLAPQVVDLVVSEGDSSFLETHRREITALFCDLRGFTAFSETVEPEEVVAVLREYHDALASLIARFGATLDHIAGDGVLVYFNDPIPCPDPPARATRMALAIREEIGALVQSWRSRGHELDFGIGIALGHATLGTIGADGLFHYASIGTVTNLASRLSDAALGDQILISARVHAALEDRVRCESVGPLELKGFARPVPAFNVLALDG